MRRLPPFTCLVPRRAEEAARLLAEHGADAMAGVGGTDLEPNSRLAREVGKPRTGKVQMCEQP